MRRLLIIILSLGLFLVVVSNLVNLAQSLHQELLTFLPAALANLIFGVVGGALLGLFALLGYLVFRFTRPPRPRPAPRLAKEKPQVAEQNLEAVQQQLEQIQDQVAREELSTRVREIQASLVEGELRVVVFGTGSAGKTSLVNSLLGRPAGAVAETMGTTTTPQTYCLQVPGAGRQIRLTDTPGILEAGCLGEEREEEARALATQADLLIFVVDNDLQKAEYLTLKALADMGKRSLLVLNKADLYLAADQEQILTRLRQRVEGLIQGLDVVAVAAAPSPVTLPSGEVFTPPPQLRPLVRRLGAILRAEGENLLADGILLRSHLLGEQARRLLDHQRRREAEAVVERFQWITAGVVAATPLPVVDLLATAAVNAQMVMAIGRVYGCDVNWERGRELSFSLGKTLLQLGIVKGVLEIVTTALDLSIVGLMVGRAIQGVSAAYLTRIAGKSFIEYFRQDQSWGDGGISEVVQRQFELNRREQFMRIFLQQAVTRVVRRLDS